MMDMNQEKIGKMIKKIRTDNNLTQEGFANLFGVTYQAVSKWENGKNVPDISIMKEICSKFNLSLDELLEGETNNKKSHKTMVITIIGSILLIAIIIGVVLLLKKPKEPSFEFKQISTSCKNFDLTGSMAYSKDKTSIYISNINYCGQENNQVYDKITCNLYETNDNVSSLITSCKENSSVTIKEYLKNVNIGVNNYTSICRKYDDTSLYLEVEAYKDEEITTYKIPISLEDNCASSKD